VALSRELDGIDAMGAADVGGVAFTAMGARPPVHGVAFTAMGARPLGHSL
jgi:hypothetical protein